MLTQDVIAELSTQYQIADPDAVRQYLASRPQLLTVLQDAPAHIAEYFGPGHPIALEIECNPEGEYADLLWGLVQISGLDVGEAIKQDRAFGEGWWLEQRRSSRGIEFDFEIVS